MGLQSWPTDRFLWTPAILVSGSFLPFQLEVQALSAEILLSDVSSCCRGLAGLAVSWVSPSYLWPGRALPLCKWQDLSSMMSRPLCVPFGACPPILPSSCSPGAAVSHCRCFWAGLGSSLAQTRHVLVSLCVLWSTWLLFHISCCLQHVSGTDFCSFDPLVSSSLGGSLTKTCDGRLASQAWPWLGAQPACGLMASSLLLSSE